MAEIDEWTAVDGYLAGLFVQPDPALERTLARSRDAGLPDIQVSGSQGRFLTVLARSLGAHRVLELGTLGGYSTICLARALPGDGLLVSLEIDPDRAELARENVRNAGLDAVVRIVEGPAATTLARLIREGEPAFDLVFLDADKPGYPSYLEPVIRLSRPGTLIIADNVVRKGAVLEEDSDDPNVIGVRAFNELLAKDARVAATVIQTVGSKGYDGFAFAVVLDAPAGTADPSPEGARP